MILIMIGLSLLCFNVVCRLIILYQGVAVTSLAFTYISMIRVQDSRWRPALGDNVTATIVDFLSWSNENKQVFNAGFRRTLKESNVPIGDTIIVNYFILTDSGREVILSFSLLIFKGGFCCFNFEVEPNPDFNVYVSQDFLLDLLSTGFRFEKSGVNLPLLRSMYLSALLSNRFRVERP